MMNMQMQMMMNMCMEEMVCKMKSMKMMMDGMCQMGMMADMDLNAMMTQFETCDEMMTMMMKMMRDMKQTA